MPKAAIYSGEKGYEELCKRTDIDLVYIAADWLHHFPVAKCALENGKNVAIEVPSAMNLQECWDLINLSEKNRKHCMILENCCYDWFEMNTLNMATTRCIWRNNPCPRSLHSQFKPVLGSLLEKRQRRQTRMAFRL